MSVRVFIIGALVALLAGVVAALIVTGWLRFTWGSPHQIPDRPITEYQDPMIT